MDEQFRTIRISKEEIALFQELDPFEKLRLLSMPYGFAIGVLSGEGEQTEKAGLLVGTLSSEMLTIEWIVIDPKFQFQGAGEILMVALFRMAEKGKITTIGTVMQPEYIKETALQEANRYFEERLFESETRIGGDLDCQLIDLANTEFMKRDIPLPAGAVPFSDLRAGKRKEYLERLGMIDNATFFYEPEIFLGTLDTDLSFVREKGDSVDAGILVAKSEDFLTPVYLYAKTGEVREALVSAALKAAVKKYGNDMGVYIMMRQEETRALVEQVMPGRPEARFLLASVSDFSGMTPE